MARIGSSTPNTIDQTARRDTTSDTDTQRRVTPEAAGGDHYEVRKGSGFMDALGSRTAEQAAVQNPVDAHGAVDGHGPIGHGDTRFEGRPSNEALIGEHATLPTDVNQGPGGAARQPLGDRTGIPLGRTIDPGGQIALRAQPNGSGYAPEDAAMDVVSNFGGTGGGAAGLLKATYDGLTDPGIDTLADFAGATASLSPDPLTRTFGIAYSLTRMADKATGFGDSLVDALIEAQEESAAAETTSPTPETAAEESTAPADPDAPDAGVPDPPATEASSTETTSSTSTEETEETEDAGTTEGTDDAGSTEGSDDAGTTDEAPAAGTPDDDGDSTPHPDDASGDNPNPDRTVERLFAAASWRPGVDGRDTVSDPGGPDTPTPESLAGLAELAASRIGLGQSDLINWGDDGGGFTAPSTGVDPDLDPPAPVVDPGNPNGPDDPA